MRDIVASSYANGLLAIGWRRSAPSGAELVLNADEAQQVELAPGDQIVVIG